MGMYTELNIGVVFKKDCDPDIINAISYMVKDAELRKEPDFPMDHKIFQTARWDWMLRSGGSYYFDAQPCLVWRFDDIAETWFLTFVLNIKNYTNEWQSFLDYIGPHLQTRGYIGTYRYEEDESPTLLYVEDGRVVFK